MRKDRSGFSRETLGSLFLRFLRFGALAWGGPIAQIAMLKRELVDEERWVSPEQFNRVYAVVQALPGPEAHELCVYFGTIARGRLGGILAGLGFMLPGFVLMLALSWAYVRYGLESPWLAAAFAGVQAAVIALIVRGVHRIGAHALVDRWAWIVAVVAAVASYAGVSFGIVLPLAGIAYATAARGRLTIAAFTLALMVLAILAPALGIAGVEPAAADAASAGALSAERRGHVGLLELFGSGLRGGLLTFGGVYAAIPYLQHDAVVRGGWMTDEQFLDGLELGGVIPAPLIIFGTFVGFLGNGWAGAFVMTAGIFLPAFAFTLVGHEFLERLTSNERLRLVLAGVTAGVVGLIAATTVRLAAAAIDGWQAAAIFAVALAILYAWRAKIAPVAVVLLAGIAGCALLAP